MMDFEAQGGNEFDNADFAQAGGEGFLAAGVGTRVVLTPDGQGVVVLPAGVSLEDVQAEGRDIVVTAADGTRYVIPEGAITVPQLEVDGVAVPPLNLAALLLGNEPQPAAGPPQSSGGNFADAVGPLQDGFGLGDLLPYTELQFPENEEREIIPDVANRRPDISIEPDDSGVSVMNAEDAVREAGLPARGSEPAGSNSAADSEGTFGFINFSSPDGTSQVAVNGVAITQVGQAFNTPFGVLTITSIADGRIGYDYTLTDNTTDAASADRFTVTITDSDGDTATATLRISIVDDVPTAADDTDTVPAGSYAAIDGNVITGQGTESGAAGADTLGADNAQVSAVANSSGQSVSGSGALVIQGAYGTLTLNADGSYNYARAPGTPGGATDTFTYTLTDGDGDTDTATLAIDIGDAPATVISVPEVGDGTIVDESGLPERDDEAPGSAEPTDVETTSGTITFAAPDGVASVTIDGVVITGAGQQIQLPEGTLTIVSYDPVGGTLEYSFTLADNTDDDATQIDLSVTVTDTDGDSDSEDFVITVIDDTPTAIDDAAAQGAEDAPVVVDVFANDIPGADSVNLVSGVSLVDGTLTGAGAVTYNNDGTFTYVPAPGEEGTVAFDYTITDGDGDTSTATVTITLADDSIPTIDVIEAQGGALVDEAGLPVGSNAAADSETTTGTFAITTGNDTVGSLVIDGVDVTGGGVVTGDYGTLTVMVSGGAYSYSYTLTTNTAGDATQDVFSVAITDSDGDSANAPLVIDIVDDVPTAADDTASPAEDTPVVIDVFANDVAGADGVDLAAGVALATGPAKGAVVYNGDGTFTYTPIPGAEGSDSFTYTITDGDGDTSTATVTIALADDSTPTIDVVEAQGGAVVDEAGLPAGSDAAADSETTAGTFAIATGNDTVGSLVIDGVDVTGGGIVAGDHGTLTVTVSGGAYSYSYTLTTNTAGDNTQDVFDVVVTDSDGDSANAPLVIDIVDDVPTARADADSVTEDGPLTADGNVLTGSGGTDANATDGVADTQGADGAVVTTTGSIPGQHGTLVLNADGSYTYTLNNADTAVQGLSAGETLTEVFSYTIEDGDGDTSSAALTITIDGTDDGVTINGLDGAGAEEVVDEDDLADGSSPDAGALTQTGTFDFSSPDGLGDVSVGGTQVVTDGVFTPGLTAVSALGTLTITGFTPLTGADGSIIGGTFSYSYTLDDNTLTHSSAGQDSVTDSFAVTVTDTDGSSAAVSLDVQVIDDVPTAQADGSSVTEGGMVAGNVLGNDEFGADGAAPGGAVTGVAAGSDTSNPIAGGIGGVIIGAYGTLTLNADGTYSYDGTPNTVPPAGATDTFVYTITDGDGDTSTTTLTIDLTDSGLAASNEDAAVDEAALAIGSDPASTAETTSGTLADNVGGGTGPYTFALVGGGTGSNGTLTLNADGTWSYTLATPVDGTTADDGPNTVNDVETFTYEVTDANGNTVTNTLTIDIVDDVPTAQADTNSVTEGGIVGGNVLTDGTDDVLGADGAAPGGAVTGVAAGSDTTNPVAGGVGAVIAGTYGTLTLNADGTYSYDGTPNAVPPAGATDTFVYTITDGDGDTSTTTLTIDLSDSGLGAVHTVALVDEAGLPSGSDAAADSEVFNGAITPSGGTGPYTYALTSPAGGAYGNLVLNADGTYTYTLDTAYDGTTADNAANTEQDRDSFSYTVTDGNGNVTAGTILVDIVDDVPTAQADTNSVTEGGVVGGNVLTDGTDDVLGADGAAPGGAVTGVVAGSDTTNPVAGGVGVVIAGSYGTLTLNADGSYSYDGTPNTVPPAGATDTFVYTITDGDGDTSTTTLTIDLTDSGLAASNEDAVVDEAALAIGSDPASIAETTSGTLADNVGGGTGPYTFALVGGGAGSNGTLTLNADGTWSYTLATPLDGTTADDGPNTVNNVETFTYEVTDANGNTVTNTLTIDIVDDVPTATDDDASPAEDTPLVIDVFANDIDGADGVDLATGVALATGPAKGNAAYNGDGTFTYTPTPGEEGSDSFTYTITDGDGDTSTATVTITLAADSAPSVSVTDGVVDEAALANGSNPASNAETTTGSFTIATGNDDIGTLVVGGTDVTGGGVVVGTYGTLTVNVAGGVYSYSYTLNDNTLDHLDDTSTGTSEGIFDSFTVELTDSDGDIVNDTLTIDVLDDGPTAQADTNSVVEGGVVGGNVLTDGTDDVLGADGAAAGGAVTGVAAGSNTTNPVAGGVGVVIAGAYGTLTLNADGSYSYQSTADAITGAETDTFVYTITDGDGDTSTTTLTIDLSDVTLVADNDTVIVDEAALDTVMDSGDVAAGAVTGSNPSSTAESATGQLNVAGATSYSGGGTGTYGTLVLNSDGSYTYTLTTPFDTSPDADNGAHTELGAEVFNYTATDANGNTVGGTITVDIVDDVPVAVAPLAVNVLNTAGSTMTADLDVDGDVGDNFGADGPGLIAFANVTNGEDSGLTSGGSAITQWLSNDGQTLQGRINSTDGSDGTLVFEIGLDQGAGTYTVTMSGSIDNGAGVSFDDLTSTSAGSSNYAGVGANDAPTTVDLLLSGSSETGAAASVNTNATGIGVANQSIGQGETVRIDFVSNLTSPAGTPSGFGFTDHVSTTSFLGHVEEVQGNQIETADFRIWALDTTLDQSGDPDRNPADGFSDSSIVSITEITVTDGQTGNTTTLDISGLAGAVAVAYDISVIRYADGSITFQGLQEGDSYGFKTASGDFNAVAVQGVRHFFDLGVFSIGTVVTGDPVELSYDLEVTDADGDSVVIPDALNITANPATPPIALDLDGDGVEFVGLDAGVAFDYDGDGSATSTAWVGADDGLLVHDANGNGAADDGSEIVFGGNGLTDLQGLAAQYDSNRDGVLDAQDTDFAKFGVWQDANGNGVTDAGEFATLGEAGIASIALVSDGEAYGAAGGDVLVHGTATYTKADGSTGLVADAEFATEQKAAQRTAEAVATAAAAGALLVPQPVLADDQAVTADEPLQRVDAGLLEMEGPDPASPTSDTALPATSDLLGAEQPQQAETAERPAEHSPEDYAPPALDSEPEMHRSAADGRGVASEPVADFDGSAFTGFQAGAGEGAIMEALLALQGTLQQAAPADAPAEALKEALGDVADGAAVDAIVDHYAGGGDVAPANSGNGEIDSAALLQALDSHLYLASNGAIAPDAMEDAALMAAAVQA